MKEEEKKGRRVQATKLDLMLGMKQREALRYKKQFGQISFFRKSLLLIN